jgi:hypothetical protein
MQRAGELMDLVTIKLMDLVTIKLMLAGLRERLRES